MTRSPTNRQADIVVAVMVLIVIYLRYSVLTSGGAPPTIDAGDWLAHGNAIFGSDIRSNTIVYPPLVPILVKTAVAAFGLTAGTSVVGALAAGIPAVGLYVALRMMGTGFSAVGPTLLLLGASSIGEAAAWGGFPQLIGFGIAPITLVLIDRLVVDWRPRGGLHAGIAFAALLATSHFVAAAVAVAGVLIFAMRLRSAVAVAPLRRLAALGLAVLPALWLAPLYVALLGAFGGGSRDFRFFNPLTWSEFWRQTEFLYRDLPWLWRPLMGLAVAAPIMLWRRRSQLWYITTATLLATIVALVITREGRYVYLLTPYAGLGIALWLAEAPRYLADLNDGWTRRGVAAAVLSGIVVAGIVQIDSGARFFDEQRGYYGVLTPDLVVGIEAVRDRTTPEAVLAVTSLNDAPFGRWVEAIADRQTFYGSPLRWLLFDVDLERSALANEIFVPPFPSAASVAEAAAAGIDLILVPTRWVFYDPGAMRTFATEHPGAVEQITSELIVIDTAKAAVMGS